MKRAFIIVIFCCLGLSVISQNNDVKVMNHFVDSLLKKMTMDEKLGQLNLLAWDGSLKTGAVSNTGVSEKIEEGMVGALFNTETVDERYNVQKLAVENSRLGIPIMFCHDVIHGHKIVYPIPLGLSCSWDMNLIEQTSRATAVEGSADGIDVFFSPMVDISRDPRWGRVAEGNGEDPYLGSKITIAEVKGYQGDKLSNDNSVMACVKHFALYGAAESGRDYNTVDMSKIKMYQDYLPPYKAAVEAGAGSFMASFNDINGIPATINKWLLTDVLRNQWNFSGFVVTDFAAIPEVGNHGIGNLSTSSALALEAGIDMDMVSEGFVHTLKDAINKGNLNEAQIDTACKRILEAKYKLGLFTDPYIRLKKQGCDQSEMIKLSRKAAQSACVLLKNEKNTLPLNKKQKVAVIGPLADTKADLLGTWVLNGDLSKVTTVVDALKNQGKVEYALGANVTDNSKIIRLTNYKPYEKTPEELLTEALEVAHKSDVIVAVLGELASMSGEAASLSQIGLQAPQRKLLEALVSTGKPVILVLINGRPLTLSWENENCAAILEAWAGGTEAANAIADVLYGKCNPSGKLTMSFPVNEGQIPVYYASKTTGRPYNQGMKYSSQYLDAPNEPLFPFGYGLSYTTYKYDTIKASSNALTKADTLTLSVNIKNSGNYDGDEIVQLYVHDEYASVTRPVKQLINFQKISLKSQESKEVTFKISTNDLKFYNADLQYDWEPGDFVFEIGSSSSDTQKVKVNWKK